MGDLEGPEGEEVMGTGAEELRDNFESILSVSFGWSKSDCKRRAADGEARAWLRRRSVSGLGGERGKEALDMEGGRGERSVVVEVMGSMWVGVGTSLSFRKAPVLGDEAGTDAESILGIDPILGWG